MIIIDIGGGDLNASYIDTCTSTIAFAVIMRILFSLDFIVTILGC